MISWALSKVLDLFFYTSLIYMLSGDWFFSLIINYHIYIIISCLATMLILMIITSFMVKESMEMMIKDIRDLKERLKKRDL